MASIEFINQRIAGKKKEIETLEKKLARINKAAASNWENNPYYYNESDLKWTQRDLDNAKAALTEWENKLSEENSKAASRNVPAINEFLDQWEQHAIEFYMNALERYTKAEEEYKQTQKDLRQQMDSFGRARWDKDDPKHEEYVKIYEESNRLYKKFYADWQFVTQFLGRSKPYEEIVKHTVAEEKKRKYDFLVDRICSIVGQITDATNLRVGAKGDLNGYVIGTEGEATVDTIGAGGYNDDIILDSGRHGQIFHYRTLIKRRK